MTLNLDISKYSKQFMVKNIGFHLKKKAVFIVTSDCLNGIKIKIFENRSSSILYNV